MAGTIFDQAWVQAVAGAFGLIVVLAMVLERALSVVFEWGAWDKWLQDKKLRAPIALVVSYIICATIKFDVLLILAKGNPADFSLAGVGTFLTAATIAGGSKGAITLFQQVLGFAKGGTPA